MGGRKERRKEERERGRTGERERRREEGEEKRKKEGVQDARTPVKDCWLHPFLAVI